MPTSTTLFDDQVRVWMLSHPYPTYIEIGPGEGRWGKIIKSVLPDTRTIGVEIDMGYIDQYHLRDIYDEVVNKSAMAYFRERYSDNFDVVMWPDGPEHMWKSEGLDLLHFLIYRTRYILITYPTAYKQGAWEGHIYEAHLSTWSDADFPWEHQHFREIGDNNIEHNLVILRGFREL